ncbi:MAG: hypothetical protein H7A48_12755 [Akkermansiaceae bacterium]|nr:hypothetical protein [Akkermansiaceae bacterium]
MATLIHLCRKDFAFARNGLFGAWAVFLAAALVPLVITGALVEAAAPILGLLLAVQYFQIFAATLKILRADSYSGGDAFIGTRPVTRNTLWLSKLLSITAFVLVPWLLEKTLGVIALRLELSPGDWLLYFIETTLVFGIPASIAWIVGTHTRGFIGSTMLTMVLAALVLWLAVAIFNRPGGFQFVEEARLLKASRWLLAQGLILLAGPLLAWGFIAKKRPVLSIAAGVVAVTLIAVASTGWQWNFARPLAVSGADAAPFTDPLEISWLDAPRISRLTRNGVEFTTVVRGARIDGAPDTWLACPTGVKSAARFPDGGVITSEAINSPYFGDASRTLLPSLGIHSPEDDPATVERWRNHVWFEGNTMELQNRPAKTATITGEARVEIYQPVVLADLPARAGANAATGRFRYRIGRIEPSPGGGIAVEVSAVGTSLLSRGDMRNPYNEIEILIVNPRTGRHTTLGSGSGSSSATFGWWCQKKQISIETNDPDERIDPVEFLKGARFYLIDRTYRGTVSVPFEIPEFRLEN